MPAFHLRLFGPPELCAMPGGPVPLRTRKHLALLVYLALETRERGVPRNRIIDLLWPGVSTEKGRHSLSQGLSAIRSALGKGAVNRSVDIVQLRCDLSTDADDPDVLQRFDGELPPVLDGLDAAGGIDFAHWVDASRRRIQRSVSRKLTTDLEQGAYGSDMGKVFERATAVYRVDPTNEKALQLLAQRCLQDGDPKRAASLLREHVKRNADRTDPCRRKTNRLLARLEAFSGSTRADVLSSPRARRHPFVGRQVQHATLESVWRQVGAGGLRTVLVGGSAGVGKSELIHRFAASIAGEGHVVLMTSCSHGARDIPFAAVADLIDALSQEPDLGATDPYWLAEASRVAPSLRCRYPGIPDPQPASRETARLSLAEALCRMVTTVADGSSALIVIDDLHRIDPASKDVLHMVARRLARQAALIVGVVRTHALSHSIAIVPSSGARLEWHYYLCLPPLTDAECRAVITAAAEQAGEPIPEDIIAASLAVGRGVPYVLEILLGDWWAHHDTSFAAFVARGDDPADRWHPTAATRAVFARHYDALSNEARHILELMAVADRPVVPDELIALCGLCLDQVHRALLDSSEAGVVTTVGDRVAFKSELHRTFVYNITPTEARKFRHARFARAVLHAAGKDASKLIEASYHFVRAEMGEEALSAAVHGAHAAIANGAPREAERALRAALKLRGGPPQPVPALLIAEAMNLQGNFSGAVDCLRPLKARLTDVRHRATAARHTAEAMVRGRLGKTEVIRRVVRANLQAARVAGDQVLIADALLARAEHSADRRDWVDLSTVEAEASSIISQPADAESRAIAQVTAGFCELSTGRYASAYRHFLACVAPLQMAHRFGLLIKAFNGSGMCASCVGELTVAVRALEQALSLAQQLGDHPTASNVASNLACLLGDFGLFTAADDRHRTALKLNETLSDNRYTAPILINIAESNIVNGHPDQAIDTLAAANEAAKRVGLPGQLAEVLLCQADALISIGRFDEACTYVALAEQRTDPNSGPGQMRTLHGVDSPNFLRLSLFKMWIQGDIQLDAMLALPGPKTPGPIGALIELSALSEWIAQKTNTVINLRPSTKQMIAATGLSGVALKLKRLGLCAWD